MLVGIALDVWEKVNIVHPNTQEGCEGCEAAGHGATFTAWGNTGALTGPCRHGMLGWH